MSQLRVGSRVRRLFGAGLVLLGSFPKSAQGLYEDEVGQYDWMLQQIGKPTALAYSAETADRIYAASASGVVSSMLLKDGTLQWRRVATSDVGVKLLRVGGRNLVSVTDDGLVQAWKGSNGELTWQRESSDKVVDLLVLGADSKQTVAIVRESEVEGRTLSAGKHEWLTSATEAGAKARFWAADTSSQGESEHICVVAAANDGTGASVLNLDASSGKVQSKAELPKEVGKGLRRGAFQVVDGHLVVLADGKVSAYPFCGQSVGKSVEAFDLAKVKSSAVAWKLQPWQRTRGVFSATDGVSTAVFGLGSKGLKLLRTIDGVAVVGPVFSVQDDETGQPVAVAVLKEEGMQLQLMDPASGNVQPAVHVTGFTAADHGEGKLLLVHELSSGEHRTVISAADHSLAGIQAAKVDWVREESLASVRQAAFYSRHTQVGSQKSDSDETMVAQLTALPGHVAELLKAPLEIASYLTKLITARKRRKESGLGLMPDAKVPTSSEELRNFGADKLILAVTGGPKLFALEATTSEVVWTKYLGAADAKCGNLPPSNGTVLDRCTPWMQLLPSAASPLAELVVMPPASAPGAARAVMWIDPLTGKLIHKEPAPSDVDIVSIMPLKGKVGQPIQPLLLIDSNKGLHVLPSGSADLKESAGKFFHYEVDTVAQVVQGFVVGHGDVKPQKLIPLWNMELGSVGERILASATPEHREWAHVPVHIKGDASILYKYINPNMLTVVSEDDKGNLNLYALDAVTGHVLHQSLIPGGAGPVHVVACDNWIVLHYRNAKRTRFEILVTEFFQAKADEGPWDILFPGKKANRTKSAHHLEMPVPLQQSYVFPAGVTSMGVTATLKGITPRSIIMGLSTDKIFRVSKDILNPRRPYSEKLVPGEKKQLPSQFAPTKDEPLFPYVPVLPVRPEEVMNYYNALGKVKGIASSPTALESTSMVFCYGLDLFFMPVQTAKAYDVLSPGFNYLLLYCSVGVVFAIFCATSILAQRKTLQDRWK